MDERVAFLKDRITELRIEKEVSEYEMSLALGHSRSYVQGISSGRSLPSFTEFFYICDYLGISPRDFFDEGADQPKLLRAAIDGLRQLSDSDLLMLLGIINRLKEYNIEPVVYDSWADPVVAKQEYGVDLITKIEELPKADCLIVAVDHNEYRSMSVMKLKDMFKPDLADEEKVIVDVKSLYRIDELKASGMRFWRL